MLKLIRKDLLLGFSTKQSIILIIYFVPVMNLLMDASYARGMIGVMIAGTGYMLTAMSFSNEVATKTYLLIQSLPIKKRDVVISKYIFTFINYILAVIITGGYLWIISLFGSRTVDSFNISLIKDTLPILLLCLSISLPLNFRLPGKVATGINLFIMFTLMDIIGKESNGIWNIFISNKGITITVILYFISMGISIWLYERKDLI